MTPEVNDTTESIFVFLSLQMKETGFTKFWDSRFLVETHLNQGYNIFMERFKVWKGFLIKGLLIIGYIFLLKTILVLYKKQLYISWRSPVEKNASG